LVAYQKVRPHEKASYIWLPQGPGGREVCERNAAGTREYRSRVQKMWERQGGICSLCAMPLRLDEATFDHEFGRGAGGAKRDDRIEVDGKPLNAAVHFWCNVEKGSKRTPYLIQPHVPTDRPIEEMLGE